MNPICRTLGLVTTVIFVLTSRGSAQTASSGVDPSVATSVSVAAPAGAAADRLRSVLEMKTLASADRSPAVFIVPGEQMTAEQLAAITEDVNVMRRIFENKLGQAHLLPQSPLWMMYRGPFKAEGEAPRSMYLEGYGVLFVMDVDYPLAPGPQVEPNETPEPQDEADPVWARTRDEIYRPASLERNRSADESRPKYSEEKVASLKTTVIQTLVHAANIRCLTPDESVIVRLTGSSESDIFAAETIAIPGTGQIQVPNSANNLWIVEGRFAETAQTVLTIRAKGADIKARAEGKLTDEQFRQRVQVFSQPVVGAAAVNTAPASAGTSITQKRRISR